MKTRKTMVERLKAIHKKHGGIVTVIKLSEMMWKYMTVLENSDGAIYGVPKRVRVPRTKHTYGLKHARGPFTVVPSRLYMTTVYTILTPGNTAHVVNRFHSAFETLYYLNGGASV